MSSSSYDIYNFNFNSYFKCIPLKYIETIALQVTADHYKCITFHANVCVNVKIMQAKEEKKMNKWE